MIAAMFTLARRRNESEVIFKNKISKSQDAFEIFHSLMSDLPFEEFLTPAAELGKQGHQESEDL